MKNPSFVQIDFFFILTSPEVYKSTWQVAPGGGRYSLYGEGGSRVAGWRDWAHFGRDYCGIAGLAEKISGISGLRKNRDRDLAKK